MNWQLPFSIDPVANPLDHSNKVLVMGSCFAEHIGQRLAGYKFQTVANPSGVLFDPLSIVRHVEYASTGRSITPNELVFHNELWHSMDHHGSFSDKAQQNVIPKINDSYTRISDALKTADLFVVTLGTSTVYKLKTTGKHVANCHKLPSEAFTKSTCSSSDVISALRRLVEWYLQGRPKGRVILTVSPVRYVREGLTESNRSKARLLDAVYSVVERYEAVHYFPAYELVVDVLRDYRFYEADLVHPNATAVQFVMEQFEKTWISSESIALNREIEQLQRGMGHRPLHPDTDNHKQFLAKLHSGYRQLRDRLPDSDWSREESFFQDI